MCFQILYFFRKLENTIIVVFQILHYKNKGSCLVHLMFYDHSFCYFQFVPNKALVCYFGKFVLNKYVCLIFNGKVFLIINNKLHMETRKLFFESNHNLNIYLNFTALLNL